MTGEKQKTPKEARRLIKWKLIIDVFAGVFMVITLVGSIVGAYYFGLMQGYQKGYHEAQGYITEVMRSVTTEEFIFDQATPTPQPTKAQKQSAPMSVTWGGPELWSAVNSKRQELGVNPLSQRDELCTIASIRLNELLALGTLDGHEGFSNLQERRPDLGWIFEKYSNVAEFLAMGGQTPGETVSMWENTLGHKKLLAGGEYVWGCIYAQNTFAVAITAF